MNHPTKTLKLDKYGLTGQITIKSPDFRHSTAIQNTIFSIIITDEVKKKLSDIEAPIEKKAYLDNLVKSQYGTSQAITLLGYIIEAPFHLNDLSHTLILDFDAFCDYMTMQIYRDLTSLVNELGDDNPL